MRHESRFPHRASASVRDFTPFATLRRFTLGRRGWTKRRLGKALRRMQSILEEGVDRGQRATVGGL